MRPVHLILIVGLAGCTAISPGVADRAQSAADSEVRAVVQVAESLFAAMEARDTLALRELFLPGSELIVVEPQPDSDPLVRRRAASEFIASVARSPEALRERMWDPQVEVQGRLATLSAPYDFHRGDRFSHCGVDVFQVVRMSSGWKIATLSYTVETTSCPRPPNRRE